MKVLVWGSAVALVWVVVLAATFTFLGLGGVIAAAVEGLGR